MGTMFRSEGALFSNRLAEWLERDEGKWVAIKGDRVIGPCNTDREAYGLAVKEFGTLEFLLRQVTTKQRRIVVPFVPGSLPSG